MDSVALASSRAHYTRPPVGSSTGIDPMLLDQLFMNPMLFMPAVMQFLESGHPMAGLLKPHCCCQMTDKERLADADKKVSEAYNFAAHKDGWSLRSQRNYLHATREAIRTYESIDPNHPKLENLRTHAGNIAKDVANKAQEVLDEGYDIAKAGKWSTASQQKYYRHVNKAIRAYRAIDPKHPRLRDLLKVRNDLGVDIRNRRYGDRSPKLTPETKARYAKRAEDLLAKGYDAASNNGWGPVHQASYYMAVTEAISLYRAIDPKHDRLTDLLKTQNDLAEDVRQSWF